MVELKFLYKWKYRPAYDCYSAPIWFGYDQLFITPAFLEDFKHPWMLRFPHLMWLLSIVLDFKRKYGRFGT
jgi:hypothetical protein